MLDFVKKAFRTGFEVILWVNLILWTIGGGIVGHYLGSLISYRNSGGYAFGGVLIGIINGLLINIVGGGFIATILNMDKNLEQLVQNEKQNGSFLLNSNKEVTTGKPFVPTTGPSFTVKQEMKLYQERNNYDKVLEVLNTGDKVEFIETGSTVCIAGKDAPMFSVKTKNDNIGWCFSGFLEKI